MNPDADSTRKVIPIAVSGDRSPIEAPQGAEPEMVALYEAHKGFTRAVFRATSPSGVGHWSF